MTLLWVMAVSEFKLTFHGTTLGYAWSLLRPLLMFGVLLAVFTQVFRFGDSVKDYPALLLLNVMLFTLFAEATQRSVTSVVARESIVRKAQFPRLVIPLSIVLTEVLDLGLNLTAVFIFILAYGVDPMWTWLLIPVIVLALLIVTVAVSMIVSALYPAIPRRPSDLDRILHDPLLRNPGAVPDRRRARAIPPHRPAQSADPDLRAGAKVGDRSERPRRARGDEGVRVAAGRLLRGPARPVRGGVLDLQARGAPNRRGALSASNPEEPAAAESRALDVVIVSYRSRELLRRCLDSLRSNPPEVPMNLVVVDNDSADGTAQMVAPSTRKSS